MNIKMIYDYLAEAEHGSTEAQDLLCHVFYQDVISMPNEFWERVEKLANDGEDYANFIMHCRYFGDPAQGSLAFVYIRKAVRHQRIPYALLRLGVMFSMGIGTIENHTLAFSYFIKSYRMGCEEALSFIDHEYDSGKRNIIFDFNHAMTHSGEDDLGYLDICNRQVERDRLKKNYGVLSHLRNHLPFLYPTYSQEDGIDDILHDHDTINADICYALSTTNNVSEYNIDILDSFLQQLFTPIMQNEQLIQDILDYEDPDIILGKDDREILQAIVNYTHSYDKICKKYGIGEKEVAAVDSLSFLPYIKPSLIAILRRQMFRCILTLKEIEPQINTFLLHLDDNEQMLLIAEKIKDQNIQLLLISFVEYNLDTDKLLYSYHSLFRAYQKHQLDILAYQLSIFVNRLSDTDIGNLPLEFTPDDLPEIEIG